MTLQFSEIHSAISFRKLESQLDVVVPNRIEIKQNIPIECIDVDFLEELTGEIL